MDLQQPLQGPENEVGFVNFELVDCTEILLLNLKLKRTVLPTNVKLNSIMNTS